MGPSLQPSFIIHSPSASVFKRQQFYSQASSLKPTNTFILSHLQNGLPPHLFTFKVEQWFTFAVFTFLLYTHMAQYHLVSEFTGTALIKPPTASCLPKPKYAFQSIFYLTSFLHLLIWLEQYSFLLTLMPRCYFSPSS